jgi:hypothetical protein
LGRSPVVCLLLALAAVAACPARAMQADRAVVVVIDGLRYTEGLGDPSAAFVPRMAALCSLGTRVEPFLNDGDTWTSAAIPASWMGGWFGSRDTVLDGKATQYALAPTFFEAYRKQLGRPATDCIYFINTVSSLWRESFDPAYGPSWWSYTHMAGSNDTAVWNEFLSVVPQYHPRLVYLYLAGVDGAGHSGSWTGYTAAIATADGIVGDLWTWLEADPFYAGRTDVLVTNDHGRHDDAHGGFRGHGDGCAGCRAIMLLALGPDFTAKRLCAGPHSLTDLAPTVGEVLGFTMPWATGEVMSDLFAPSGAGVAPGPSGPALQLSLAPNPWRSAQRVGWVLPRPGDVTLELLDLTGRVRRTVRRPGERDGRGSLAWAPRDDHGAALEPGVYFARLRQGAAAVIRRTAILR